MPPGLNGKVFILLAKPFFSRTDNMGTFPFCTWAPNFLKDEMCKENRSCVLASPSICTAACSQGKCISSPFPYLFPYKEGFPDTWKKPLLFFPTSLSGRFWVLNPSYSWIGQNWLLCTLSFTPQTHANEHAEKGMQWNYKCSSAREGSKLC